MTIALPLQLCYESDLFVVVSNDDTSNPAYEIVSKPHCRSTFLTGAGAQVLWTQTKAWQVDVPEQEEVDKFLESLAWLGGQTMAIH